MNITNIKPVKIGNSYIAKVNKFPKNVYLATTSRGTVLEVNIELAEEFDTITEIRDLAYAYAYAICIPYVK